MRLSSYLKLATKSVPLPEAWKAFDPGDNDKGERVIGFWAKKKGDKSGLPWPGDLVDKSMDSEEKKLVAQYLASGHRSHGAMGNAPCRLCTKTLGSANFRNDGWTWPERLEHYVLEHNVRLPDEFVKLVNRLDHIEMRTPCDSQRYLPDRLNGTASS